MPSRLEFPFTERDTPALRARIARDLDRVANAVRAADPHLDALVLTGGFSRGEGTALDDHPVNDYDLIAVRSRPGDGPYPELAHALTREVGLEVDLMPVWRARLPHVGPKLFWLDLRLGGRVILGDADVLERVRRIDPRDVPPSEPARLLGNRAAGMLLSLPAGEAPDLHQRDLQATKAVLAAMDAVLLTRGLYAPRMRDRLDLSSSHRDRSLFAIAVAWKLDPTSPLPSGWWAKARDALLRAVDETGARDALDGPAEHVLHLARGRRLAWCPSRAVRRRAWDLLAQSRWPDGPAGGLFERPWPAQKRAFFEARARTLQ